MVPGQRGTMTRAGIDGELHRTPEPLWPWNMADYQRRQTMRKQQLVHSGEVNSMSEAKMRKVMFKTEQMKSESHEGRISQRNDPQKLVMSLS